jgi:putative membrane protein
MNLRNRSLPLGSALAVGLALTGTALFTGCAESSRQTRAYAPTPPQTAPSREYGAAMGQPTTGPSTGMTGPTGAAVPGSSEYPEGQPAPAPATPEYAPPSAAGPNTMPYAPYGSQGGPGSPSGMAGTPPMGPSAGGGAPPGPSGLVGGPMDVSGFDDAQLAAIVQAINMSEMQSAQLAESRAMSPELRRFARDMETQHRDMQSRANAVFSRSQMTPSENPVSARLKSEAQSELSTLQSMKGKDFDRAYLESEVRDHNGALELIDRMIADAKSPELKAELENMRPKVEAHLRKAEGMEQTIVTPKGTTNKQRGTNPY